MARSLIVAALALALLPAAAGAAAARPPHCANGKTLAQSEHARVFYTRHAREGTNHRIWGCLFSRDRAFRLDVEGEFGTEAHEPFRLAGAYVAFGETSWGHDGAEDSEYVSVVDLRTGRVVRNGYLFSTNRPLLGHLQALVLRRTGSVAWLARGNHSLGGGEPQPDRLVVIRMDARGRKLLDEGTDVSGLTLCDGPHLCWNSGGVRRTASLR